MCETLRPWEKCQVVPISLITSSLGPTNAKAILIPLLTAQGSLSIFKPCIYHRLLSKQEQLDKSIHVLLSASDLSAVSMLGSWTFYLQHAKDDCDIKVGVDRDRGGGGGGFAILHWNDKHEPTCELRLTSLGTQAELSSPPGSVALTCSAVVVVLLNAKSTKGQGTLNFL